MPHKPNSENAQKPSENIDFIVLCQYLMKILHLLKNLILKSSLLPLCGLKSKYAISHLFLRKAENNLNDASLLNIWYYLDGRRNKRCQRDKTGSRAVATDYSKANIQNHLFLLTVLWLKDNRWKLGIRLICWEMTSVLSTLYKNRNQREHACFLAQVIFEEYQWKKENYSLFQILSFSTPYESSLMFPLRTSKYWVLCQEHATYIVHIWETTFTNNCQTVYSLQLFVNDKSFFFIRFYMSSRYSYHFLYRYLHERERLLCIPSIWHRQSKL